MFQYSKITNDVFYVGGSDTRIALFENVYPVPKGISYNSYLIKGEKNILLDTVDKSVFDAFLSNVVELLSGENLDYIIVNHVEPDHCATLEKVIKLYPTAKILCSAKALGMLKQFFNDDIEQYIQTVAEGETLSTGTHTFSFYMAPMVHWPEVMVTYETSNKILFSADGFGTFGALNGNIFADEVDFENKWLDEARRYYTNIVGKYGPQVQALLKKAATLDVKYICPLHGPIWRENLGWFIDKYDKWSRYESEEDSVMIAYSSVYGGTENAAKILAGDLANLGFKNIALYDVSVTHYSYIIADAFKYSHLVFAVNTYNNGIFPSMDMLLRAIKEHAIQNKTIGIIENGSWAPTAGKQTIEILSSLKNITMIEPMVTIKSTVKEADRENLLNLAKSLKG